MDHLTEQFINSPLHLLPWVAFIAGLGGSLHCVGMCGGLVTVCAPNKSSIFSYQIGRLIGYSFLGLFSGFLGQLFALQKASPYVTVLPALSIGILLIFWGVRSWQGKRAEIPLPMFIRRFHTKLWHKVLPGGVTTTTSHQWHALIVGLLSIFLPCGLLYGIVLTLAAFQDLFITVICMIAFWLGTVPAMSLAPQVIQKVLRPVMKRLPGVSSFALITIGIATISIRFIQVFSDNTCH